MDAAMLLIAANETCPQPQTAEHLAAVDIMKLDHIIILQNKIDLVRESDALRQHATIREYVKGTPAGKTNQTLLSSQGTRFMIFYDISVFTDHSHFRSDAL